MVGESTAVLVGWKGTACPFAASSLGHWAGSDTYHRMSEIEAFPVSISSWECSVK